VSLLLQGQNSYCSSHLLCNAPPSVVCMCSESGMVDTYFEDLLLMNIYYLNSSRKKRRKQLKVCNILFPTNAISSIVWLNHENEEELSDFLGG